MYPTITITMQDENHVTVYEHITNFIETMPSIEQDMRTAWTQYLEDVTNASKDSFLDTCTEHGNIKPDDIIMESEVL